ncbi:TrbC/VirB2 family protein [Roseobacter weihaiensis]|uniref:TrbC/VirB2 family protein n=1 Tax=Roseobacter weihaiensis TaxID=2763262 RepID=UPI001D0AF91C|nr:TrbC/VirB2 family protein [Roseobacter sp. H9]
MSTTTTPPTRWQKFGAMLTFSAVLLIHSAVPASAQGFTDFLNNILDEFNNVRRPLALIAIILVGFAFMFNLIDLRKTGYAIVGIIVIFSAVEILALITGA